MNNYNEQAEKFAKLHNIKLKINHSEYKKYFDDDKEQRYVFNCTLTRNKKRYTFNFGQSISAGNEEPTIYNILSTLTKYSPETFEFFCSNYGYNEDSRKAYKTYLAVCKEYEAMERLFGDILEELREIE
jgi:hypothetical protein